MLSNDRKMFRFKENTENQLRVVTGLKRRQKESFKCAIHSSWRPKFVLNILRFSTRHEIFNEGRILMLSLMSVGVSSISHLYFDFPASCKVRFEAPQNYMIDNRISVSLFHIFLQPLYWSSSGRGSKTPRLTRRKEMPREKSANFT